ncbi:MAG: hypothetical protein KKA65_00965 [Nanoarchaeota archaeon]|nr:hypothetical protein [Nanoarchaeota archaeon]MBU4352315.1 hypothetical protein [Nanoarchaeota archaeon]MBU4456049.1 hypothetical protein [Nanoarchaeota archaeon]MCG2719858.1 hypothetical protein [Nanoarchaeota archaeon]
MGDDLYLKCQCSQGAFSNEYLISFHTNDGAEKFCFVKKEDVIVQEEPSRINHPEGLVKIVLKRLEKNNAIVRITDVGNQEVRDYTVDTYRIVNQSKIK